MSVFSTRRIAKVREGAAWLVGAALLGMNLVLAGCAGLVGANGNPNPTAPAILQVSTANITKNSAQIDWTTNVAATSQGQYGTTATFSLTVSTSALSGGTVGAGFSSSLQASGRTSPYTWTLASGTLPSGLTLSTAGAISGTPTAAATSSFTVQVKDAANATATKALSIVVGAAAKTPMASTTSLAGSTGRSS